MIFVSILAGGTGQRIGNIDKPKQFLFLGDKPILIHTVEKFYINNAFEDIIIPVPKNWTNYVEDLIDNYISDSSKISIIEGGNSRNESILSTIKYIKENYNIGEDDILLTHDAVRPFVTHRIIMDNVRLCQEYGATNTVIPATDTIAESIDGEFISKIPNRAVMFQGQTPQAFKILRFEKLYNSLHRDTKSILTDAANVSVLNNEKVAIVKGEITNVKITYAYDLNLANHILKDMELNNK